MGLDAKYLADTSAVTRISNPEIATGLGPLVEGGLVARCTPTDLEAGFSSTSSSAHVAMREYRPASHGSPPNGLSQQAQPRSDRCTIP